MEPAQDSQAFSEKVSDRDMICLIIGVAELVRLFLEEFAG